MSTWLVLLGANALGLTPADRRKLGQAFAALKALPIPPGTDSHELEEWRAILIEVDAFYAGIASTVLNGGSIEYHLEDLDTLAVTLASIQPHTDGDRKSHEAARKYLEHLQKVREALGAGS